MLLREPRMPPQGIRITERKLVRGAYELEVKDRDHGTFEYEVNHYPSKKDWPYRVARAHVERSSFDEAWAFALAKFDVIRGRRPRRMPDGWFRHSSMCVERSAFGLKCFIVRGIRSTTLRWGKWYHYTIRSEENEILTIKGKARSLKSAQWFCNKVILLAQEMKASEER